MTLQKWRRERGEFPVCLNKTPGSLSPAGTSDITIIVSITFFVRFRTDHRPMMSVRQDGVSIVQGEISMLLSSMRRGSRWSGHVRTVSDR